MSKQFERAHHRETKDAHCNEDISIYVEVVGMLKLHFAD